MMVLSMNTINKDSDINKLRLCKSNKYSYLTEKEKLLLIDAMLNELFPNNLPGASLMIIKEGQILFKKGYGLAKYQENIRISPDTQFYLASMSKQFTAMAIMMLAEEKKLSYDDYLVKYFPELSHYGQGITLRHLLNHTSGLPDYFKLIEDAVGITNKDVLRILVNEKHRNFEPGEMYTYNNSNYVLLAILVERISGMDFHQYMESKIFRPLGMKDTFVYYNKFMPNLKNRALGYDLKDDGVHILDYDRLTAGGGGVYSTTNDLYKWDQALYTEKLVKKSTLEIAFNPGKLTNNQAIGYGFGWKMGKFRGLSFVTHTGSSRGFRTRIKRFPEQNFSIIMLCNFCQAEREIIDKIAEIFLEDVMSKNHSTYLHLAVDNEHKDIVESLINGNCDLLIRDENQRTVLDLAIESGNIEIIKMLMNKLREIDTEQVSQYEAPLNRLALRLLLGDRHEEGMKILELISHMGRGM